MSADQLSRAADHAEFLAGLEHPEWLAAISERDATVAALLRAAAVYHEAPDSAAFLAVLNTVDDVAAAYLGEEAQP